MKNLIVASLLIVMAIPYSTFANETEENNETPEEVEAIADANDGVAGEIANEAKVTKRKKSQKRTLKPKKRLSAQRKKAQNKCIIDIIDGAPNTEAKECRQYRRHVTSCFARIRARVSLAPFCQAVSQRNLAVKNCKRLFNAKKSLGHFCQSLSFAKAARKKKQGKEKVAELIEQLNGDQAEKHSPDYCHKTTNDQASFAVCVSESSKVVTSGDTSPKRQPQRAPATLGNPIYADDESEGGENIDSAE